MLTDEAGNSDNDGLGIGKRFQSTRVGHAIAHHTDKNGYRHGDHYPGGGDPAAERQLFLFLNGHEAQQDMRHAEISQAPGQQRTDRQ